VYVVVSLVIVMFSFASDMNNAVILGSDINNLVALLSGKNNLVALSSD